MQSSSFSRRRTTSTKAFFLAEVGTGDFAKYLVEIVPETSGVCKPERKPQMLVEVSWLGRQGQFGLSRRGSRGRKQISQRPITGQIKS